MNKNKAQDLRICCVCGFPVSRLTGVNLTRYRATSLCPECWNTAGDNSKLMQHIPVQVPIPNIGKVSAFIKLPPITFGQIVLYRNDLLVDWIIKVVPLDSKNNCAFTLIPPNEEALERVKKFIEGDNDA